jgi:hypothetical protein
MNAAVVRSADQVEKEDGPTNLIYPSVRMTLTNLEIYGIHMVSNMRYCNYVDIMVYLSGYVVQIIPCFGMPPMPGSEVACSIINITGSLLFVIWATISWASRYSPGCRMAMAVAGAIFAAIHTPGTVRMISHVRPDLEDVSVMILHAMTILIIAIPLIKVIKDTLCNRRNGRAIHNSEDK